MLINLFHVQNFPVLRAEVERVIWSTNEISRAVDNPANKCSEIGLHGEQNVIDFYQNANALHFPLFTA